MQHPLNQLGNHGDIGHTPAPGLHAERQFEAVGTQSALVHNSEVSPNGTGKSGNYAVWEASRSFNNMIQHVSASPQYSLAAT
jgi:hypothetical protein